jgi:hypothetical protein
MLELLGTSISVLRHSRLRAFLPKVLAGLAKRLRYTGYRPDDVFLARIESGCHLLSGLIRHRGAGSFTLSS